LQQPAPARDCPLTDFPSYAELLSIRPIAAVPDSHHLVIQSRLDSARNPDALQARYSVTLSRAAIERLHAHLGRYLARGPNMTEPSDPSGDRAPGDSSGRQLLDGLTPEQRLRMARLVGMLLNLPPHKRWKMMAELRAKRDARAPKG